jgi:ubiquinone/menaquinone biosynthesis C-methylase UbiE
MISFEDITIESYDKTYKEYIDKADKLHPIEYSNKFSSMIKKDSLILDLGCGYGRDAKIFCENGYNVIGIDLSKNMIKEAKERVKNAKFFVMDLRKLDFEDNYFDAIWASASFLHIQKKEILKALKESYRVLKKGGIMYVSVKEGEGEILKTDLRYGKVKKFWAFYKENEIKEKLIKAGFTIIESSIEERMYEHQTNLFIKIFCKKI